ncbi:hypothetical protein KIL84_007866, partial [Mauremys mutica]
RVLYDGQNYTAEEEKVHATKSLSLERRLSQSRGCRHPRAVGKFGSLGLACPSPRYQQRDGELRDRLSLDGASRLSGRGGGTGTGLEMAGAVKVENK